MGSTLLKRLQSRKLWIAIGCGIVVVFGKALGLNLNEVQVNDVMYIGISYILGQGAVDAIGIHKGGI